MIIGIGGSSNSGKSHLAQEIIQNLKEFSIIHLCQDNYIKYSGDLTNFQGHTDWELPSTLKFDEYYQAVLDAEKKYDIVLVEGLFAFSYEKLYSLYTGKIYLELDKPTFVARKLMDNRWGIEPLNYIEHIWNSHQIYGLGLLKPPYLKLDGSKDNNLTPTCEYIVSLTAATLKH